MNKKHVVIMVAPLFLFCLSSCARNDEPHSTEHSARKIRVSVIGPPALVGAIVTSADVPVRMGRARRDGQVQSNHDIELPVTAALLTIKQEGCQPVLVTLRSAREHEIVRIDQHVLKCQGVVGGALDFPPPK